ncbi:MAG: isopropylmalate isomerase [Rhodobacteraceae bacterium]|nr:isopropylmalate isomerase [Paracoccaceae bacterium]
MFQTIDLARLRTCTFDRWSPTIGDPSVAGWLTVAAYGLCAVLAFRVWRRGAGKSGRAGLFWALTCIAMAFLTVNKQLDLQSLLTATGRCVAGQKGWYDDRRAFQRQFIEGLLVVIVVMLGCGVYLLRHDLRRNGLALLGLAFVGGFVAVRAVGFHHFDAMLNLRLQNVAVNVILELSGLVLIAVNAVALLRQGRRHH